MHEKRGILRGIELNDPVHVGDVDSARCDVRAEQNAGYNSSLGERETLRFSEIFHGFDALLLHHAAVERSQLDSIQNVQREKSGCQEIDLSARQEENDYFFLRMKVNKPK